MDTVNEGLSADELTAASDPISCRQVFWDALAVADESLAVEAASLARPPAVTSQRFDFDEVDDVLGDGRIGEGMYSPLVLPVEPGSPSAVLNAWNSVSKTVLFELEFDKMCLAKNPTDKGAGKMDFRACVTEGCQLVSHRGVEDGGSQPKFRLRRTGDVVGSTLAIKVVPSSKGQKLETVFSRPLFRLSDLPPMIEGAEDNRKAILLRLSLKPVVFKFLLEGYPGRDELTLRLQVKGLLPSDSVVFSTPRTSQSTASHQRLSGDEVTRSPGLAAVLTTLPTTEEHGEVEAAATAHKVEEEWGIRNAARMMRTPPSSNPYPWNRDIASEQWGGDAGSVTSLSSVGINSTTGDRAIARLTDKLENVIKGVNVLKRDVAKKDTDLGNVIYSLRVSEAAHAHEIQELRDTVEQLSLSPNSPSYSVPTHLTGMDKEGIIAEVLKDMPLEEYARKSDLEGYATRADLDMFVKFQDLTDYAKTTVLTGYVTSTQLDNMGFATSSDLQRAMENLGIPDRLMDRFINLEKQVMDPGGLLRALEDKVKELLTRKGGTEVTMGGTNFKNQQSTDAWASCLGDGEIVSFGYDMVVQVLGLTSNLSTSADVTKAKADAIKAGFTSIASAATTASFSLPYPETIFRPSTKAKDAARGGLMFAPALSSPDCFEGNAEFSSKTEFLATLSTNRERHQQSIDGRFPRDQPKHAKTNAVFSAMCRLGYFQAVGFLESLLPFHKMMHQAGLSDEEAWTKCLTYARAVFARVYEVRTTSSQHTVGSMLYGMMRATQLLQGYGELGWIRHPDVSSALVVAALQKEGKAVTEALSKAKIKDPQVTSNKTSITSLDAKLKDLIRKNPTLNT